MRFQSVALARLQFAGFAALACAASGLPAHAADAEVGYAVRTDNRIEEIVVRALRRTTRWIDAPLQVSVLRADDLRKADVLTMEDLDVKVPNTFFSGAGNYGGATLAIRGIGGSSTVFGEEPIAIFFDDQYLPRTGNASSSLLDLESIEVLRGPQVTLYGRNATGGAVLLRSARPRLDKSDGFARVSGAEFGDHRLEAAFGGPLNDNFAVRAAAQYVDRDGWAKNVSTGQRMDYFESTRGRVSALWQIDARSELYGVVEASKSESRVARSRYAINTDNSVRIPRSARQEIESGRIANDSPNFSEFEDRRAALTLTRQYNGFELVIDGGYFYGDALGATDSDGTGARIFENVGYFEIEVLTQNVRLVSTGGGRLDWIVGASAVQDDFDMPYFFIRNYRAFGGRGGDFRFHSGLETRAYAAYAEAGYTLTDRLKVTAGVRATRETKDVEVDTLFLILSSGGLLVDPPPYHDDDSWTAVKPRLIAEYALTDDSNVYASVSTGFKSGGYNAFGQVPAYDEEDIVAYEAGYKGRFLNGRLEISSAVFAYDYDNLQLRLGVPTGGVAVTNAARARIFGAEAEWRLMVNDRLTLSGSLALLDTEFRDYVTRDLAGALVDASGNELSRAPDWQFTLIADYEQPIAHNLELGARASISSRDSVYFRETNQDSRAWYGEPLTEVDARLSLGAQDGGWELAAFVQNATDNITVVSAEAAGDFPIASFNEPRKFGVELTLRF